MHSLASTLTRIGAVPVLRLGWLKGIHPPEWVALVFFVYLGLLGLFQRLALTPRLILFAAPAVLCTLWWLEASRSSTRSKEIRQWSSLGLILLGYWSLGWFSSAPMESWQMVWTGWDRALLDTFHLRDAVEVTGAFVPSMLESVYLLLYTIPPISLGVVYGFGGRARANRYLLVLFLGTFSTYALLPLFPAISPRVAFPGSDLPHFSSTARGINTWLLDHLDIATSVFPSGHVAVAFSSAFGLLAVLRQRRMVWMTAFVAASAVYVATVYGRYHYAVDGLASAGITAAAWKISTQLRVDEN